MREIRFRIWDEFPKYEIGENGTVFSLGYNNTDKRKELKQYKDRDGYKYVFLVVDNKRYKRLVHRLVAISFIENTLCKPQVNHKDGVRDNNILENLEWATAKENALHGYRSNGRTHSKKQIEISSKLFKGVNNPKSKLTEAEVLSIRRLRSKGESLKYISERIGISVSQVSSIANYKSWR